MTRQGSDSAAGAAMRSRDVPIPNLTRDQMRRATAVVLDRLGDSPDGHTVLEALLAPPRKSLPPHGAETDPERTAWLQRCRGWFAEQGQPLAGSWVPAAMQRRYAEATGDVYEPGGAR